MVEAKCMNYLLIIISNAASFIMNWDYHLLLKQKLLTHKLTIYKTLHFKIWNLINKIQLIPMSRITICDLSVNLLLNIMNFVLSQRLTIPFNCNEGQQHNIKQIRCCTWNNTLDNKISTLPVTCPAFLKDCNP